MLCFSFVAYFFRHSNFSTSESTYIVQLQNNLALKILLNMHTISNPHRVEQNAIKILESVQLVLCPVWACIVCKTYCEYPTLVYLNL